MTYNEPGATYAGWRTTTTYDGRRGPVTAGTKPRRTGPTKAHSQADRRKERGRDRR